MSSICKANHTYYLLLITYNLRDMSSICKANHTYYLLLITYNLIVNHTYYLLPITYNLRKKQESALHLKD